MPDPFDPLGLVLRLVGAFYAFAGVVAARAAFMSALMDTAIAGLSGKRVSVPERALSWWFIASAWGLFAGGVLLIALAREAMWVFIVSALTQGLYLTLLAPYYFDKYDPPDERGRRQTTTAFFVYTGATILVIWASGRALTPLSALDPVIQGVAVAALLGFAGYVIWSYLKVTSIPPVSPAADGCSKSPAPRETEAPDREQ